MNLISHTPSQAMSKALLRLRPTRAELDTFTMNLRELLAAINDSETEEFNKNLISDFLRRSFYYPNYFINTKAANDLVIHNGAEARFAVGVIVEAKKPTNKAEMVRVDNINVKAFQELLLYYLRERFGATRNLEMRHLVVTNAYEWFIFDAVFFEQTFAHDRNLVKKFLDFESGILSGINTEFFYKEIAAPAIAAIKGDVPFTYIDLRDYRAALDGTDAAKDKKISRLFKVLSPTHLLKLPVGNDSNTLNRSFYTELLHIIGLKETKVGTKRLIGRKEPGKRDAGSLLENAISQLDAMDKLRLLSDPGRFGTTDEERLFAVALELVITWINRVLFIKLLEAQLLSYHKTTQQHAILNAHLVPDYGTLNSLFFQILARETNTRDSDLQSRFSHVPYLNSSLFEPTALEHETIVISALADKTMPILSGTILRDHLDRKRTGDIRVLDYLFQFLDAYDFGSDAASEVQEQNKPLINASVLGLIFEKINGYKEGSYFTPGFVTMYISREVVRRAVVQQFNRIKGWNCDSVQDVYDKIDDRGEANAIINSIRLCDPAVGSGHFLVSALNELIALKSELRILEDRSGRRLKEYQVDVVNDDLLITDENGAFVHYVPSNRESQRVQEAVFHEKEVIIENCLFGVDVNPNSANICRLRLWIELLKHAYYKTDGELETLPNIDINIKRGNSLISRFPLDEDLQPALKRKKVRIGDYRAAVAAYQNARSKDEKRKMERFIAQLKGDLRTEIFDNDPSVKRLRRLRAELDMLRNQQLLFPESVKEKKRRASRESELLGEIAKLEATVKQVRENRIFVDALEWRFEYPEVLGDDGAFTGFDALIGNPPYGVSIKGIEREYLIATIEKVPDYEIYYWFISRARQLLRQGGVLGFIVPNTILFNVFAAGYRLALFDKWRIDEVLDCTSFSIFDDAAVRNVIFTLTKQTGATNLIYRNTDGADSFGDLVSRPRLEVTQDVVIANNANWGLLFKLEPAVLRLVERLRQFPTLEGPFRASQGFIPYRKSDLIASYGPEKGEAIVRQRQWHANRKVNDEYIEELYGESLTPYTYTPSGSFVWYGTHVASYVDPRFFTERRLLIREITDPRIVACIVEGAYVNDPQIINVIVATGERSLDALWGIFSSRLATWYHFNASPKATKGLFPKILVTDVKTFPLPLRASEHLWTELESLVAEIHAAKKGNGNADVRLTQAKIDRVVYKMYGLTNDEIRTVEASGMA
jgi:adenine-specific DNA-methyltransferase